MLCIGANLRSNTQSYGEKSFQEVHCDTRLTFHTDYCKEHRELLFSNRR